MLNKTYFISRHGCAKNQVDAELIVGHLTALGWELTEDVQSADVIIINSCGFIEPAKRESLDAVFQAHKENPKAKIVLAGCLAQRYASAVSDQLSEVDVFFGNGDIGKITEVFSRLEQVLKTDAGTSEKTQASLQKIWLYPQRGVSCGARPILFNDKRTAYIKITEGCSNHCSFCAIPLIRGEVRSRPIVDIVSEISELIKKGVFEFNLIGQDLAAFSTMPNEPYVNSIFTVSDKTFSLYQNAAVNSAALPEKLSSLAQLLLALKELPDDFRIRLLYIHPDHFLLDILPIIASDKRFLPYFDIPFQSGSTQILKAMNRKGNAKIYLNLIRAIMEYGKKTAYRRACIRTTFLTGFPGESDDNFDETVTFLQNMKPIWSGVFEFSPEEDTPAYSVKPRIPKKIIAARKNRLQHLQTEISETQLKTFLGEPLTVLVEDIINNPEEENRFILARAWFQAPEVDGAVVVTVYDEKAANRIHKNDFIQVKVIAVHNMDIEAELVNAF